MTLADLGARCGVVHSTVGRWETGDRTPSLSDIPRIAAALEMSPEELAAALVAPPPADKESEDPNV